MKIFAAFLLLTLPSLPGSAQPGGSETLYQRSLAAYADASQESMHGKPIRVWESETLRCSEALDALPPVAGSSRVECMRASSLRSDRRRIGSDYPVVEIKAIREFPDGLFVDCAEYRVGVRRGKITLGVYGGYRVYWRFDCAKNQFVKTQVVRYSPFTL